jgi:hypothetical protein
VTSSTVAPVVSKSQSTPKSLQAYLYIDILLWHQFWVEHVN